MSCKLDINTYIELASNSFIWNNKWIWCYVNKTEANLASVRSLAARCVRVIHAQCVLQFALLSRTLLRSSSNNEPSDPPYRIIIFFLYFRFDSYSMTNNNDLLNGKGLEIRQHMNYSSRRILIHMNMSSYFDT